MRNVVFPYRNLRTIIVLTLILLAVVSGTLTTTQPPPVQACSGCNFLLTWGSGPSSLNGQFDGPHGVAVDGSGNVYVTDFSNDRVEKFTSTGTFITTWGSAGGDNGQFEQVRGVAVDSSGNVYVADSGNERVQKFTSTGTFTTTWGSLGSGKGSFNTPYGVAADSSGNVYVTDQLDNRVEKFTSSGNFMTQWGCATPSSSFPSCTAGSGNGEFSGPRGVAVDSAGNVYVADYGNNRVEKFTNTGTYVTQWGCATPSATVPACPASSSDGQFNGPNYVAADSSGGVYVTDFTNNRFEKFTSTGTFVKTWGGAGTSDGDFNEPIGVAADPAGDVYVVDGGNNRVQLFGDTLLASLSLVDGWNLISLPIVPLSTAIGNVLEGLIVGHNFTIVWSYQGGGWKSFLPPTTGPLTTMQNGFGYWIYMNGPGTLNVLGYVVPPGASAPPTYSLSAGWNLVGFNPPNTPPASETVSQYLASISGDYSAVEIYTSATLTWTAAGASTTVYLGQAMWIYMTTPATLIPEDPTSTTTSTTTVTTT